MSFMFEDFRSLATWLHDQHRLSDEAYERMLVKLRHEEQLTLLVCVLLLTLLALVTVCLGR